MNDLIMYLSHDRQHVATHQRISSIPTNSTHHLQSDHVATYFAPSSSIQSPTATRQLVACTVSRMTWQFIRGALRTTSGKI